MLHHYDWSRCASIVSSPANLPGRGWCPKFQAAVVQLRPLLLRCSPCCWSTGAATEIRTLRSGAVAWSCLTGDALLSGYYPTTAAALLAPEDRTPPVRHLRGPGARCWRRHRRAAGGAALRAAELPAAREAGTCRPCWTANLTLAPAAGPTRPYRLVDGGGLSTTTKRPGCRARPGSGLAAPIRRSRSAATLAAVSALPRRTARPLRRQLRELLHYHCGGAARCARASSCWTRSA